MVIVSRKLYTCIVSINQSKVLTKLHTGKEKPHPNTTSEGSKPCVTKCRRLGQAAWGPKNESRQHLASIRNSFVCSTTFYSGVQRKVFVDTPP